MPKKILAEGEINEHAHEVYNTLKSVPLFYVKEVLELALEGRERDGADSDLDISDTESSCSELSIESETWSSSGEESEEDSP